MLSDKLPPIVRIFSVRTSPHLAETASVVTFAPKLKEHARSAKYGSKMQPNTVVEYYSYRLSCSCGFKRSTSLRNGAHIPHEDENDVAL